MKTNCIRIISFKTIFTLILFYILFLSGFNAQENNKYIYSINLSEAANYMLDVTLIPPAVTTDEIIFHFPKMVPGTYHVYDFGRFISDIKAYDNSGNELPVEPVDSSSWRIKNAVKLSKITYKAHDTWHPQNKYNFVFEPAGTNFDKQGGFVLNTHAIFGYFDGMKRLPLEINIIKPSGYYGSTALIPVSSDESADKYVVDSYYLLTDSPMMYTIPDTAIVKVGGADVLISVNSPDKTITSKFLAKHLSTILEAQKTYLGGTLPVNKYAFLFNLMPNTFKGSGNAGALEHSYSSMYFYYEADSLQALNYILPNAAHEFFHIITPLSIHSEQIHDFDYDNPVMSKHLWLYEGITEYTADLARVREGLITPDEYLKILRTKINVSGRFNDTLPFTVMSKNALTTYEDEYQNVYYKGALIGACLDLTLRNLSNGKYGVRDMIKDLSAKYGKDKPFNDDELFDVITSMTFPEVRTFFANYVEGNKRLPLNEIFGLAGVEYQPKKQVKDISFGSITVSLDHASDKVKVVSLGDADDFGKEMGYEEGDIINKIYNFQIGAKNFNYFVQMMMDNYVKEGDELVVEVLRNGKPIQLQQTFRKVKMFKHNYVGFVKNPSPRQFLIRDSWLGHD
jgi:predicted metalloprotease with PDZ domain